MSYIKDEFINRVLVDEGKRYKKNQGLEMEKRLKFHTHHLFNDRTQTVSSEGDMKATLKLRFPAYERFLDIKRKVKTYKRGKGRKIKKGYRIHNRFAYGHYSSIGYRIANEFSPELAAQIKKDLTGK